MIQAIILEPLFWIMLTIFFLVINIGIGIFIFLLFRKTHIKTELKAFIKKTPIAIFFQDNRFAEWKPLTPINGVVYDEHYGPFIVSTTYVDKKTKNIIMPFDVDLDGDRTSKLKDVVEKFRYISSNEKSISSLRMRISAETEDISGDKDIQNLTSKIKYGALLRLFQGTAPHMIKSKTEKMVAERLQRYGNVNPIQALLVFGGIFGIIVMGAIILNTMGVM